ncbi:MAG TPA: GTP-binding protein [Alphaproteobacteria bacterium]
MTGRPDGDPRCPVTLVTGFLGSGKTTLLAALLARPALADSAVVINEFGEVAIDDALVGGRAGEVVRLESGCICCTARGGLEHALVDLARRRDAGTVPGFARVLVETTGLADPVPVVRALHATAALAKRYRLAAVVVTVDAVTGFRRLDDAPEALRQVALADRILVTKTDLASADAGARLEARLAAVNPGAARHRVVKGRIDPEIVLAPAGVAALDAAIFDAAHNHGHDPDIATFTVDLGPPLPRAAFERWLDTLLAHRGEDLLRVKGAVAFAGEARPMLVNIAGGLLHPLEPLDGDVSAPANLLVFITRRLPAAVIRGSLAAALDRLGAE